MTQRIRASTQIFDDLHLLLTPEDVERLSKAVISDPSSGEHRVYELKRLPDGKFAIVWESEPEP